MYFGWIRQRFSWIIPVIFSLSIIYSQSSVACQGLFTPSTSSEVKPVFLWTGSIYDIDWKRVYPEILAYAEIRLRIAGHSWETPIGVIYQERISSMFIRIFRDQRIGHIQIGDDVLAMLKGAMITELRGAFQQSVRGRLKKFSLTNQVYAYVEDMLIEFILREDIGIPERVAWTDEVRYIKDLAREIIKNTKNKKKKIALELLFIEEMSVDQVSKEMPDVPLNTLRVWYFRGKDSIRKLWTERRDMKTWQLFIDR